MNVRHVTRVSRPASRQRVQTEAVKFLPVCSLVQRCSTTASETIKSNSKHVLQMNLSIAGGLHLLPRTLTDAVFALVPLRIAAINPQIQ
jgi:hypothetical protein